MLLEIYLFLAGTGILFLIFSMVRKDLLIFGWLASVIFLFLSVLSFDIEKNFCEAGNVSIGEWSCYTLHYSAFGLNWFWLGLGLIMLAYSIIYSIKEISPV